MKPQGIRRWMRSAVITACTALGAGLPILVSAASVPSGRDAAGVRQTIAQSAYIGFKEVAPGTAVRGQYGMLGFHFSAGTVELRGGTPWLMGQDRELRIRLWDDTSGAALATHQLSFDLDAMSGGGRFQVRVADRKGATVSTSVASAGTRVQLQHADMSRVTVTPLGNTAGWAIAKLRSGAAEAPVEAAGFEVCTTYGGDPNNTMVLILAGAASGVASVMTSNAGCGTLPAESEMVSLTLYTYFVPPMVTCLSYNDQPIARQFVAGAYLPIAFRTTPEADGSLNISTFTNRQGCMTIDEGSTTIGYVSLQEALIDLSQ